MSEQNTSRTVKPASQMSMQEKADELQSYVDNGTAVTKSRFDQLMADSDVSTRDSWRSYLQSAGALSVDQLFTLQRTDTEDWKQATAKADAPQSGRGSSKAGVSYKPAQRILEEDEIASPTTMSDQGA